MNLTELKKKIKEDLYAEVLVGDAPITYADYTMDDIRELVADHDRLETEITLYKATFLQLKDKYNIVYGDIDISDLRGRIE